VPMLTAVHPRYMKMKFPKYEFVEYPKIVYAVGADGQPLRDNNGKRIGREVADAKAEEVARLEFAEKFGKKAAAPSASKPDDGDSRKPAA
jgi:hypothetical protein